MIRGLEALARPAEKASDRRGIALRLLGELAPHRATLLAALALIAVSASMQAVGPWLIGRAIDRDILGHDPAGLARTAVVLLAVYCIGALAQRGQTYRIGTVGQRVLAGIRERLFRHFEQLPLAFYVRRPVGDLMSRVLNDVDTLNQLFAMGLTQLLGALVSLTGILVAMLALNWRLALASFVIIPIMLIQTALFARAARKAFRATRETTGDVTADLQEEIVGVREAQAFNRTQVNIERFRRRNAANRDANVNAVGITSAFSPAIDILSTLATGIVIGYGSYLVLHGELTVGLVAAFLVYVQQFFRPVQLASQVYTQLQSALAGAERIYAILDEAPEAPDAPGARPIDRAEGAIAFEGVSFAYQADRPVLSDVSFFVAPGQTVALVGETGAGKTTIAQLLPRFYEPASGRILLDGHDLHDLERASLRRQIALVPQEPFMFAGTVADNLAYGRPEATRAEIEEAARQVGAHEFIRTLPEGYDTELGEGTSTLSQGQKQLLALARAILADRPVLILDEATSHVDTRTEAALQAALARLMEGRTSVVIAHRLSTIRKADQILVIDGGRVVERGSHAELLERGGAYARLHRLQFGPTGPSAEDGVEHLA